MRTHLIKPKHSSKMAFNFHANALSQAETFNEVSFDQLMLQCLLADSMLDNAGLKGLLAKNS